MVKHLSTTLLTGIIALAFAVVPAAAQNDQVTDQSQKLDKKLLETLKKAPEPTRVIIRTKDGQTTLLRRALQAHGDVVETQHNELSAVTAVVHGEDILAIANDPSVESVSIDAVVRSMGSKYRAARKVVREVKTAKARARGKSQVAKARAKAKKAARPTTKQVKVRTKKTRTKATTIAVPKEIIGDARKFQGLGPGMPTGAGIGVAIIDSGIDDDYANFNITAFVDFTVGGEPVWTNPYDDFGHGTHIASLIASQGKEKLDGKYQGVAPGARLIGLKVLDEHGAGRTSDVMAAIEYAILNKTWLGIDVINLSLGHPIYESAATDPLVKAVEEAHRAGIVVVVSAGNFGMSPLSREVGYGGLTSPGNSPSAITVGAVDTKKTTRRDDDSIAPFSSRGPTWVDGFAKPDLVAPGVGEVGSKSKYGSLFTTYPQLLFDDEEGHESDDDKRFARMSGTSMAAAEVSGVVALVLEANPHLTANLVKGILEYTATPLFNKDGLLYDFLTQGAGEVNGAGAITLARAINTAPEFTDSWPIGEFVPETTFDKDPVAWSQNIVWGNYSVESLAHALFTRSAAWDDNIVWGSMGRSDDDNIVWGNFSRDEDDNIVWGNLAIWGSLYDREQRDNIVWGNFSRDDENIVWGNTVGGDDDNIVWGNFYRGDDDNIVWGNFTRDGDDNIVWGNTFIWDDNIVWGNSLLGMRDEEDNIVWGNLFTWDGDDDNIVWGNLDDDNIVWGNFYRGDDGENIVWGNSIVIGF